MTSNKIINRVLILGGTGMLGHQLIYRFKDRFDTFTAVRQTFDKLPPDIFNKERTITQVSAESFETVTRAVDKVKPQAVVNCIGIVKQQKAAKDPIPSIAVNALFPHLLAQYCHGKQVRVIHVSTDCVFSGNKGSYKESDEADAQDLYGRTKFLGELDYENTVTIRTSIIGHELNSIQGLLEWFISQQGKSVEGYTNAVFSGFTTKALAEVIVEILKHRNLSGVWHVASSPISKFDLLSLINKEYGLDVTIKPNTAFSCNRSLNAHRFTKATGFNPPSWEKMIQEMYEDYSIYKRLRRFYAHK